MLLAWGYDATYEGDYTERLFRDPTQYGVADLTERD